MKKTEIKQDFAIRLLICMLIGLATVLLAMAVCSFGVLTGALAALPLSVLASGCLMLGCFLAAFRAARCSPGQKLLWALLVGGGLFLCLLILSFLCCGEAVDGLRIASNAGCVLAASLLGGFLGAAGRRKKKKH